MAMKRQKFAIGAKVRVGDIPPSMSHFTSNVDAYVIGTYNEQYGGGNIDSYSLLLMNKKGSKVKGGVSWYYESQLTLISDDTLIGHKVIADYKARGV